MKNNKEKIDALIKKYFNVEYYNLKNRIESSLDEIAKSDNATKNFETNIENAIKENKSDVKDFDKIVIDVFKTLKNQTSNYDYEYDTDNSQKSDTKDNSNDVENKISNLESDLKKAAQRIQEAKLNKNDKLYVQARAEFSSLVKEISKLKNQNNLQKSTAREFSDFSTLFNLNDDNSTNYSSGNSNDNPITSDDDIEEDYLYGVEYNRKDAYEWLMSVLDEDGPLIWKEGQKIYCKNVELQNQVIEYLKSKDYSVLQDCEIVKQEDMICGFAINRTYYYVTVSDSINNNLSCQKYKDVPKAEVDEIEEESFENDTILWNELKKHRGHKISIVSYGDWENPTDICLECEDCGEIILDAEIYTLCARENC